MAETKSTPTPPTVTFVFNEEAVKAKFGRIEDGVNKVAGKKGQNPFVWLHDTVNPLIERFMKNNERSKELQDAILALPDVPPSPFKVPAVEEPKVEPVAKLSPTGINIPPPKNN